MYHKLRSTLAGLTMASSFAVAGLLFGSPVTPDATPQAVQVATAAPAESAPAVSTDRLAIQAMLRIAVALLEAQAAVDAAEAIADAAPTGDVTSDKQAHPVSRTVSKRLQLKMPYYSFGALLSPRGES